ncbi:MAG: hypothetical protein GX130_05830 [Candidatus Hydrogenedens sp.]|nr:hypothetical protein [Candidatus Hydrogenedens sp.]
MSLDLTGISNVNEFYGDYYLDALFEKDTKELADRWLAAEEEKGCIPPDKAFSACGQLYFKAKARAEETTRVEDNFFEARPVNIALLEALGYEYESGRYELLDDQSLIPVLATYQRAGEPWLWLLEAPFPTRRDEDNTATLERGLLPCQNPPTSSELADFSLAQGNWENLFSAIFQKELKPRWLILFAGSEIYLIDRHKWGQGKYMLFDLDELFGRRSRDTLRAAALLLSRDAINPDEALPLHDSLDENSHKHAFSVSSDLQYGIRRAVELLGNEYVWYQRNIGKKAVFSDEALARALTEESLLYLYRLLFLFYAEARGGELDVAPMKSDEYRLGYSLETLRDLELAPLTTPEAQNGYFFDESLRKLFTLINDGHNPLQTEMESTLAREEEVAEYIDRGFTLRGLNSPLFDLKRTPRLSAVRLRNSILQEVIQLLSLSRVGGTRRGGRRDRGRISYAQLGINQLGAVYEGVLSYTGFFAQETLYEMKAADQKAGDETDQAWFVPESRISDYKEEEFVREAVEGDVPGATQRKKYEKGSFIFRLAGRDRESSASYYTPECLTQSVVKYSLKELLKDKTADEILQLRLCEPAMGSAAFINEGVNQLAQAYLEKKQAETGELIPPSDYTEERQRVKAFLAEHNCYGVDLNPIATELARTSLWLNTIHRGSQCPWFGLRLATGNSLVGARRQIFDAADLRDKSKKTNWLSLSPLPLALGPQWLERPRQGVYHFLVADDDMAAFDKNKAMRELMPDAVKGITAWRKAFCQPYDQYDTDKLLELSAAIDELWQQVIRERREAVAKTTKSPRLWGQPHRQSPTPLYEEQDRIAAELQRPYTAFRRLKLIMDYWCALWFWPLDQSELLPTRDSFLLEVELILKGTVTGGDAESLFMGLEQEEALSADHVAFVKKFGRVNVDTLCKDVPRLGLVQEIAKQRNFLHWELQFAEVFADKGGFDLILGNPPWIKVGWNEGGLLAEFEPFFALRKLSADAMARQRHKYLTQEVRLKEYCSEFVGQTATKAFLNARQNYPLLEKIQTNLYKCFITRSWEIAAEGGVIGLVHPEGVYDDARGGRLRKALYIRLRAHFQFINELILFDISHTRHYSINIYENKIGKPISFLHMSNLFHPLTIDGSMQHDGEGNVPGYKNENNQWELRPHRHRLLTIDKDRLKLMASLYDSPGTPPLEARLPVIHSEEIIQVLKKIAHQHRRLSDLDDLFFSTVMFDETYAQRDGIIRRETQQLKDVRDWVLSGPHFFVGTPFAKTPNEGCKHGLDYTSIDLTVIDPDYLPRTNYLPACSPEEYKQQTPHWKEKAVTEFFRHVHRRMCDTTGERTLISTICPPGAAHINTVLSVVFDDYITLCLVEGLLHSLVYDFFIKTTGKSDLFIDTFVQLPLPSTETLNQEIVTRALKLTCLTSHYADLWNALMPTPWTWESALRTDLERRQALVELDALAALALDLTEEELITIYRVQFSVLQGYEQNNRYDRLGRLVPGAVLKLAEQMEVDIREPLKRSGYRGDGALLGEVVLPGGERSVGIRWEDPKMEPRMERVYVPPFKKNDREKDMREAYRRFKKLNHG